MSDPFDRLRSLDSGHRALTATAAEVRRRGDRRRRRRGMTVAVCAAAAVTAAAVAIPASILNIGDDDRLRPAAPVTSFSESPSSSPPMSTPTSVTPDTTTPPVTSGLGEIPGNFPLLAGWPDSGEAELEPGWGRQGPSPVLDYPELEFAACGEPLPLPPVTGRLQAAYLDAEDFRGRQLLTFTEAKEATAFVGETVEFYSGCPEEAEGDFVSTYTVVPTQVGGQSFAIGRTTTLNSEPSFPLVVVQVVRLGRSVLLDYTYGEGTGGTDPAAATRERAALMTENAEEVVAAMCAFTTTGC